MKKYKCDRVAEIGIRVGVNFRQFIKHNPEVAVAVDCWEAGVLSRNDVGYTQPELERQYNEFMADLGSKPNVQTYREYSFDAVKHFPDNYFDCIYIDADHTYEGVLRDLKDWYPKVKKRGFLLGDDYVDRVAKSGVKFGVVEAVNEFAKTNNIKFYTYPHQKWVIIT